MILSHIVPIEGKAGTGRREKAKWSCNVPEDSAQDPLRESPGTHPCRHVRPGSRSHQKVFPLFLHCKSLFKFFFSVLNPSLLKSLGPKAGNLYHISFQVVYIGISLQVTHFHTRERDMKALSKKKVGLFLEFSGISLDCVQLICMGILGMG